MLSYKRSVRVAELLQQEISKIVMELNNPGLGFVTVTGVKLTDDLQQARIFYSVIGNNEEIERSGKILHDALPSIRHLIAEKINLRRTPSLTFEFDTTPSRAERIFSILEQISAENKQPAPAVSVPKIEPRVKTAKRSTKKRATIKRKTK